MHTRTPHSYVRGMVFATALTILLACNQQLRAAGTLFVSDTTFGPTDFVHAFDAATGCCKCRTSRYCRPLAWQLASTVICMWPTRTLD